MFLTYIVPSELHALTLDQILREALLLSAKEARDAKRIGITVDGSPFFPTQRPAFDAGYAPAQRAG